jgi:hypothetical protein
MFFTSPRDITKWKVGQEGFTEILQKENTVHMSRIRDFTYLRDLSPADEKYVSQSFDITQIHEVGIYSTPFGPRNVFSHLIIAFEWMDGSTLGLSFEARRRPGESYSLARGFLPYYGLLPIWGTLWDLIGLRLGARGERVEYSPLYLKSSDQSELLRRLLARSIQLEKIPELYHSLTHNCTTNLLREILALRGISSCPLHPQVVCSAHCFSYLKNRGFIKESSVRLLEPISELYFIRDRSEFDLYIR